MNVKETMYSSFSSENSIDPKYFDKYSVKRGLRNLDGTGVMAGVTNICNVHGYVVDDGEKRAAEGKLIFRGYSMDLKKSYFCYLQEGCRIRKNLKNLI